MQEQKGSFSQSRDHKQSSGKDGWVQSTTYNLEEEDKMSRGFFSLQSRRDFFEPEPSHRKKFSRHLEFFIQWKTGERKRARDRQEKG